MGGKKGTSPEREIVEKQRRKAEKLRIPKAERHGPAGHGNENLETPD